MEKLAFGAEVLADWTDYNGHFNVAYYALAFDQAASRFWDARAVAERPTVRRTAISYAQEAHVGSRLLFEWRCMAVRDVGAQQHEIVSRVAMFVEGGTDPIAVQERREVTKTALPPTILSALPKVKSDPHSPRGWDQLVTVPSNAD